MPMVTDKEEGKMKGKSDFLDKFQDGDKLSIKSNLFHVDSHYLQGDKMSVLCKDKDCFFCNQGVDTRKEYLYVVERTRDEDVEKGVARVPASVFYDMNKNEKLLKKSKREFEWLIGKEGEGKNTRYSTVRGDSVEISEKELAENNKKLKETGEGYTKYLKDKYLEKSNLSEEKVEESSTDSTEEDDYIPF